MGAQWADVSASSHIVVLGFDVKAEGMIPTEKLESLIAQLKRKTTKYVLLRIHWSSWTLLAMEESPSSM